MSKKHYTPVELKEDMLAAEVSRPSEPEEVFEEPVEVKNFKMGKVEGCTKLNVRKRPNATAEVVCVIDHDTEVEINLDKSTAKFYKICTATGVEGFCMKEFISVK